MVCNGCNKIVSVTYSKHKEQGYYKNGTEYTFYKEYCSKCWYHVCNTVKIDGIKKVLEPLPGVLYQITGGPGEKCLSNGNTWKESKIKNTNKKGRK